MVGDRLRLRGQHRPQSGDVGVPIRCADERRTDPRRVDPEGLPYFPTVVLSRRWSAFLVAVGAWTWLIWPRFAVAIWNDDRSWSGASGTPTRFLWVHALLIVASLALGTAVGVLGVRAWWATRAGDKL